MTEKPKKPMPKSLILELILMPILGVWIVLDVLTQDWASATFWALIMLCFAYWADKDWKEWQSKDDPEVVDES